MRPTESTHSEITREASPMARFRNLLAITLTTAAPFGYAACGNETANETPPVQTQSDAGQSDAGLDASSEDSGFEDANGEDSGNEDSGNKDAGGEDAGIEDAGFDADAETDLCAGIDTNGHGTCSAGVVTCDPGFANNDANPAEDCDGCDTASGLYENDYPLCSADVTPPITPVIDEPCGGENCTIDQGQSDYTILGTTAPDTHEIRYNVDGGPFVPLAGYTAFSTSFSYNGNIPNPFEDDNVCFKAVDQAQNESGTDCIIITRLP